MQKGKVTKIFSVIVSLNMFLAYGVFPFNDTGYSVRDNVVVSAAGVEYTVSGDTMTISGNGAVTVNGVKNNITDDVNKVVIEEGITSLEKYAFRNQTGVVSVELPSSLTTVGLYAFAGCNKLKNITIKNGPQSVGNGAFSGCASLISITISESVSSVGNWAFQGCSGLNCVVFEGSLSDIKFGIPAFSTLKGNGVIRQNGLSGLRLLSENETDAEVINKLIEAGVPESWFEKIVPTKEMFDVTLPTGAGLIYDGTAKTVLATLKEGNPECGEITVSYKNEAGSIVKAPVETGIYTVYLNIQENEYYKSSTIESGQFEIVNAVYKVHDLECANGTVKSAKTTCGLGEKVTVTVSPASGYFITSVTYNDGTDHGIIPVDGEYSFSMPEKDVTVKATFEKPEAVAAIPATCTETGSKAYWTLAGKNYEDKECTKEIADLAVWKVVAKSDHDFAEAAVIPATCTKNGSKTEKCSNCNEEKVTVISATGHKWGDWTVTKEATETENGIETRVCSVCKSEETRKTDLLPHTCVPGEPVITPATCTEDGSKVIKCVSCGEIISSEKLEKTGHTSGEWEVEKKPTCTEDGKSVQKCTTCGEVLDTKVIEARGHTAGEWTVDKKTTCTEDGMSVQKCTACGEILNTKVIDATGHTSGEWEVEKKPTCTEDGKSVQKCTTCGEIFDTKIIEATGHIAGEFKVKTEAKCGVAGLEVQNCKECGEKLAEKEIPALEHKYSWTVTKEPTETEAGVKTGACEYCKDIRTEEVAPLGHTHRPGDYETIPATCTKDGKSVQKCTGCGEILDTKIIKATGHASGEWTAEKNPTCTEDGKSVQKCAECGEILDTKIIKATGHTAGEWTAEKNPTCTENGKSVQKCTKCGEILDTKVIEATGHTADEWAAEKKPTCTEDGKSVQKCTECGEILDTKVIEATGHTAGEFKVKTEAKCGVAGLEVQSCTECGEKLAEKKIPALEHKYSWTVTKEPTETEAGVNTGVCEYCGDTQTEEISPLGHTHKPGEYETVVMPTCTEDGKSVQKCTGCGEVLDVKIIESEGHKWNSEATVDKAATCTETGRQSVHCSVCDENKDEKIIPATGHKFTEWTVSQNVSWTKNGVETRKCIKDGTVETRVVEECWASWLVKSIKSIWKAIRDYR